MAERFTEEQKKSQREIYEQLRVQALEAQDRGRDIIGVGVEDLRELFNVCRVRLGDHSQRVLGEPNYRFAMSVYPFLSERFNQKRLLETVRRSALSIGYAKFDYRE